MDEKPVEQRLVTLELKVELLQRQVTDLRDALAEAFGRLGLLEQGRGGCDATTR